MRTKITSIIFVVVVLVSSAVLGFFLHRQSVQTAVWDDLARLLPVQPLSPAEVQTTLGPIFSRADHDSALGHVTLANGDLWRFAFRSHHVLGTDDSFSVFAGPLGTFRLRGSYFCCEVQFPDSPMPKDSHAFLAFLQQVHTSCEQLP
ncbi:MAG: hypothetical protein OJI67_18180 [Prosthecobacter sp.]|nr:hypothetical protein [Prosthecobacter sp.]